MCVVCRRQMANGYVLPAGSIRDAIGSMAPRMARSNAKLLAAPRWSRRRPRRRRPLCLCRPPHLRRRNGLCSSSNCSNNSNNSEINFKRNKRNKRSNPNNPASSSSRPAACRARPWSPPPPARLPRRLFPRRHRRRSRRTCGAANPRQNPRTLPNLLLQNPNRPRALPRPNHYCALPHSPPVHRSRQAAARLRQISHFTGNRALTIMDRACLASTSSNTVGRA